MILTGVSDWIAWRTTVRSTLAVTIASVGDERVYQVDMDEGFRPFRRDVEWWQATEVTIHSLRQRLELTRDKKNWGYPFRYGLLAISEHDMGLIADAMASTFVVG